MSAAKRALSVLSALRNAPLATSVALRHTGYDSVHATAIGLRALPPAVRHALADRLHGAKPSPFKALALSADGREDAAQKALHAATETASKRRLRRLVATAVAIDYPAEARRVLDLLDTDDPRLAALVAARTGDLSQALHHAYRAGWRATRLRKQLAGELTVLQPEKSLSAPPPTRAFTPTPGRILHIVTNTLPDSTAGYGVRTHGIAVGQRQIALDAHVATRLGYPVTVGKLTASRRADVDRVPYHRLLPLWPISSRPDRALNQDIAATRRLVYKLRPAVLHAHSKHINGQVALSVGAEVGIPVIYEVRGFLEETWRSRGREEAADAYQLAREAETYCMASADMVVTLANVMRDEIVSRGVPADRIAVVPNAVDDRFLKQPPDPTGVRLRLGIGEDQVTIGLISTLNRYEGIDTLIDAVGDLRLAGANVHLLIVGHGPAATSLLAQCKARDLDDAATFTGLVPYEAVRDYYAAIDVFCVPRANLPVTRMVTPLKPLEAMAIGRPVVASDLAPLREIVDPGVTGLLSPPGDSTALAETLEVLVNDPAERARMGKAAHNWVAEHRTWRAAAAKYRDIYRRVGAEL